MAPGPVPGKETATGRSGDMDAERAEFLAPIPSWRTPRSARGSGLPDNEAFAAPGSRRPQPAAAPGGQHKRAGQAA